MFDPLGRPPSAGDLDSARWKGPRPPDLEARLATEIRRLRASGWAPPASNRRTPYADVRVFGDARDRLADLVQAQIDHENALHAEAWRRLAGRAAGLPEAGSTIAAPREGAVIDGPPRHSEETADARGLLFDPDFSGLQPSDSGRGGEPGLLRLASYEPTTGPDDLHRSPDPGAQLRPVRLATLARDPITGRPCLRGSLSGDAGFGCGPGGGGGFGGSGGGLGGGLGIGSALLGLIGGAGQALINALTPGSTPESRHPFGKQGFAVIPNPLPPKPPKDFAPVDTGKSRAENIPVDVPEANQTPPSPAEEDSGPFQLIFPDQSGDINDAIYVVESQGGRLGNFDTREHVLEVEKWVKEHHKNWRHLSGGSKDETAILGPGSAWKEHPDSLGGDGRPGMKFPDLLFELPDKSLLAINTVSVRADGQVKKEELDAAEAIRRSTRHIQVWLVKKPHQLNK